MANPVLETSNENAAGTSFTKPSGLANGDVLYLYYWQFHSASGAPSGPSGFTEITVGGQVNAGGSGFIEARLYRKVITSAGTEPASYSVTPGSGSNFANGGEIYRVSGVDTTTPENATPAFASGTGTTATSSSITTTVADCLLLALIVSDGASISTPTGMSQTFTHDGGDAEGYSQGLTGTVSGTTRSSTLGASQEWGFAIVPIAPPGGGGGGGRTSNFITLLGVS